MINSLYCQYQANQAEVKRIGRFLVTGVWNTVFGLLAYTLLYTWLHKEVNYLVIMIPANILAVTNAYIGYKLFVFKTKGHVLREYFRFYVVYGVSILMNFVIMFLMVDGLGIHPLISQFAGVAVTTVCSYIGHRHFSFGSKKQPGNRE
jgi:putative flippase GtrA